MKSIILLLATLFFISCSDRVYVEDGISIDGVLIWGEDVSFVSTQVAASVAIQTVDSRDDVNTDVTENWRAICKTRPVHSDIYILKGYESCDAIVAHEFGHYLGYEHSDDTNSVMHKEILDLDRPLNTYSEFDYRLIQ